LSYEDFKLTLTKPGVINELISLLFEDAVKENEKQKRAKLPKSKLKQQFAKYLKLIDKRNFIILRDKVETFD
jgi:hypothetical protein